MRRSEFNRGVGGYKVGQTFEMVDGPQKGVTFEITKIGVKDADGFNAAELKYSSGEIEIAAIAILDDMLDGKFEFGVKFI